MKKKKFISNGRLCTVLISSILFIGTFINVQAQVINESFEESVWTSVSGVGSVNLASSTALTLSVYTTYGASGTVSSAITNYSGNWLYSGATYSTQNTGTNTGLRSQRSRIASIKLNSSRSYVITPIITGGIAEVTFWIGGSGGITTIGLLTGTNTISENPANTSWITSAVIVSNQTVASSIVTSGTATATFIQKVTYNVSYTDPCQVVIGNLVSSGSGSAYIDDIVIMGAILLPQLATPSIGVPSAPNNEGFTANWTDVSNESSYTVIVYKASNNSVVKTITGVGANSTSTNITGLSSNTSYYYTVTAIGDDVNYRNSLPSTASSSVRTLSNQKAITSFVLLGATGVINETAKTINVVVPYSSNLTISHTPTVTVSVHANYIPVGAQPFTEGIPVTYTVTAEDNSTQDYAVTVTKAPASTACNITAFSLGVVNENVAISQASGTITVTVPGTQNITSIVPSISISQSAAITSPASLSTTPFTATDFTNPVIITVLAEDGLAQKQYTVTVTKDATSPVLESSNPSDGSQSASLAGLITLTYDENVKLGTGTITLSGGTLGVPTISGATVKIPFSGLVSLTDYTLTIPAGMFTDMYGNPSAAKTISFKTADGVNRNFPYASHMDGANFDLPAFITGGTYDVTADTKASTTTQYGAYKLAPGEKLTITSSKVGTVQATFYAMGGNRSFTISNNSNVDVKYGYLNDYDNYGTLYNPIFQTIDSSVETEVYLTNTSVSGDIYIGYIYISDVGQPALNEKDVWCK